MSSSEVAVAIDGLGKAYRIAHEREHMVRGTMAEALVRRLRRPLARTTYEQFWALRDVSLEIPRGQAIGIIGRNGAGKSTLLKVLSRITSPTEGRVELRGRVGSLLEVGTGFHPELTGRENIFLNGSIIGMTRREISARFDEIVDFAGISRFLDTPVKRYSSGMYVRLAFSVAAHLQSDILIVDEVLAVGDVEFQKKCMGKMSEVAGEGRTVLFVSHNMPAVQQLTEQAVYLQSGRVAESGPTSFVIHRYLKSTSGQPGQRIELDHAERPYRDMSGAARFLRSAVDGDGVIDPGGCLALEISITACDALPECGLVLHVLTEVEQPVGTAIVPRISLKGGSTTARVQVGPLWLRPGIYTMSATLFEGRLGEGRGNADHVPCIATFIAGGWPEELRLPPTWPRVWGDVAFPAGVHPSMTGQDDHFVAARMLEAGDGGVSR